MPLENVKQIHNRFYQFGPKGPADRAAVRPSSLLSPLWPSTRAALTFPRPILLTRARASAPRTHHDVAAQLPPRISLGGLALLQQLARPICSGLCDPAGKSAHVSRAHARSPVPRP
jgi:hypothetical protein